MGYELLIAKDFITTMWAKGTTTELVCVPFDASLKLLNFDFRLSIATIKTGSKFSVLSGVSRTLVVLEGELKLKHINHHSISLPQFGIDNFEGDWETYSSGKSLVFNVMTKGNRKGKVTPFPLGIYDEIQFQSCIEAEASFLYVHSGKVEVVIEGEKKNSEANNLFVLSQCTNLTVRALSDAVVLVVEIIKKTS